MRPQLKHTLSLKQSPILLTQVQTALQVLELPFDALCEVIEEQVADNPALEFCGGYIPQFKAMNERHYIESTLTEKKTLASYLRSQVEISPLKEEIIGSLNEKGFLTEEPKEIADRLCLSVDEVEKELEELKQLEPKGLFAKDARESLLLQLRKGSIGYQIIDDHYKLFLKRDRKTLAKILSLSQAEVEAVIQKQILTKSPFPGLSFSIDVNPGVKAGLSIEKEEKGWRLTFLSTFYPTFRIKEELLGERKGVMGQYVREGKYLIQLMQDRKEQLEKIVIAIIKRQEKYLLGESSVLSSLSYTKLATELGIHISTLSRLVKSKYLKTPVGIFPLSHFFQREQSKSSDLSIVEAKALLQKLIDHEDKKRPHPDELLAKLLKKEGVLCSRRTVAKYRSQMGIPGAYSRVMA